MGDSVVLIHLDGSKEQQKITKMYSYEGVNQMPIESAESGEIIALSGFENVYISETISDSSNPVALPYVNIEEPTIAMYFCVNTPHLPDAKESTLLHRNSVTVSTASFV